MTVLDLIEILQLNKENNIFIPLPSGQNFKTHSVFDVSSKKIIFCKELTLSEFYDSKKDISYDLISYFQKNVGSVYNNKRELLRYITITKTSLKKCSHSHSIEKGRSYAPFINDVLVFL